MKALIINGAREGETTLKVPHNLILQALSEQGYKVESLLVRDLNIESCVGCFGCWLKTPGVCEIDDDGKNIPEAIIKSDLVVYLTPVVFGGPSSELKKVMDRIIPLILPFFKKIKGEIHHAPRYNKYPNIISLGVLPQRDDDSENIFKKLINRNALNWYSPHYVGDVLHLTSPEAEMMSKINNLLGNMEVAKC